MVVFISVAGEGDARAEGGPTTDGGRAPGVAGGRPKPGAGARGGSAVGPCIALMRASSCAVRAACEKPGGERGARERKARRKGAAGDGSRAFGGIGECDWVRGSRGAPRAPPRWICDAGCSPGICCRRTRRRSPCRRGSARPGPPRSRVEYSRHSWRYLLPAAAASRGRPRSTRHARRAPETIRGHPPNLREGARDELGACGDATSNERGGPGAASTAHRRHPRKLRQVVAQAKDSVRAARRESRNLHFSSDPSPFKTAFPRSIETSSTRGFPFDSTSSRFHLPFQRGATSRASYVSPSRPSPSPATPSHARDASLRYVLEEPQVLVLLCHPANLPRRRILEQRLRRVEERSVRLQLFPRVIRHQRRRHPSRVPARVPT